MFVRGMANLSHLVNIDDKDVMNTPYGSVSPETRTSDDTLSIWRIESREDFMDAALNIILPMNKIDKAAFMLIQESILDKYELRYVQEDPVKQYIKDSKALHYNIVGLKTKNLENVLKVFLEVREADEELENEEDRLIIPWVKAETREHVKEACHKDRILIESLSEGMKTEIDKLK